jgi:hypothetical protein
MSEKENRSVELNQTFNSVFIDNILAFIEEKFGKVRSVSNFSF